MLNHESPSRKDSKLKSASPCSPPLRACLAAAEIYEPSVGFNRFQVALASRNNNGLSLSSGLGWPPEATDASVSSGFVVWKAKPKTNGLDGLCFTKRIFQGPWFADITHLLSRHLALSWMGSEIKQTLRFTSRLLLVTLLKFLPRKHQRVSKSIGRRPNLAWFWLQRFLCLIHCSQEGSSTVVPINNCRKPRPFPPPLDPSTSVAALLHAPNAVGREPARNQIRLLFNKQGQCKNTFREKKKRCWLQFSKRP